MFKIDIDTSVLSKRMSDLEKRQLPFATMQALNDSMFAVRTRWQKAMPEVFDRPTPLTINAVLYKKATKQNLVAEVYLRNEASKGTPPSRYLIAQVRGGARDEKPFEHLLRRAGVLGQDEFAVPAKGFPLDQYGNIPGGVLTRILADVQASRDPLARSTAASRAKRQKARKISGRAVYFVARKGARINTGREQHLPPGIYERVPFASGSSVRLAIAFVSRPTYGKRFDAEGMARQAFNQAFPAAFSKRMIDALRNARIK